MSNFKWDFMNEKKEEEPSSTEKSSSSRELSVFSRWTTYVYIVFAIALVYAGWRLYGKYKTAGKESSDHSHHSHHSRHSRSRHSHSHSHPRVDVLDIKMKFRV
jgi:hypothetical protein